MCSSFTIRPVADVLLQPSENAVDTFFISSSMFADLDAAKLSSNHYKGNRGATAGGILNKLKWPQFQSHQLL